jgi:hypothetical protein
MRKHLGEFEVYACPRENISGKEETQDSVSDGRKVE